MVGAKGSVQPALCLLTKSIFYSPKHYSSLRTSKSEFRVEGLDAFVLAIAGSPPSPRPSAHAPRSRPHSTSTSGHFAESPREESGTRDESRCPRRVCPREGPS